MAPGVKLGRSQSRNIAMRWRRQVAEWKRDAQAGVSTMDQAHIRGLVTAVHLSVAGLPRSWIGDRSIARPLKNHEDSPHRAWDRVTDPAVVSMCCERILLIAWFQERAGFSTGGRQRASIAGGRPNPQYKPQKLRLAAPFLNFSWITLAPAIVTPSMKSSCV